MDNLTGFFFFSEDIDFEYSETPSINGVLEKILVDHQETLGNISIVFCSDEYLLNMNKEYLQHDFFTDIITFPMNQSPMSGDLFISIDRVRENAIKSNSSFNEELNRVIIHGVLHLVGYGDKSVQEVEVMRNKEDFYLNMCP